MTTFSDVFGGSSVQPADVGFRAVTLAASITTVWPPFATTGNELARIMKVSASSASLTITLPDATLASAGMDCLFDNSGANTFTVLDSAGNSVATLTAGQVKYLYLSDNSTAAGTWRVTLFGTGSSTLDASQLSGYGLKALNNTLNAAPVLSSISADTTVTSADRAKVFLWTGGAGALTLPTTTASTSDFHIEVRNQGTGVLTLTPVGGALIDGASTVALTVNESCFVHMGASDWYTIGRGRNSAFNFTHLSKAVTGGSTSLSLTEASNVVQTYTGILTSNQTVILPAVVQVYYITNNTTGAYSLSFKCVTTGSATIAVTQTQSVIIFCDGSTVVNNNTSTVSGITSLVFAAGSAAIPSCAISTSDNGLYAPAGDQVGMAINGAAAGLWTASGYKTVGSTAQALSAYSSGAGATLEVDRAVGFVGSVNFKTAGVDRWKWNMDTVAEAGANAGSNLNLSSYDDAGSLLGTVMTVNRSTQVVTFTQILPGYSTPGLQTAWIPAGAMTSRTTNGAAANTIETSTNKVMIKTLDFDTATQEYAQFTVKMPKSWNKGTLTFKTEWSHAATTTNFGVAWSLAAVAIGDGAALDAARGTDVVVTDTGGTTNYGYATATSAAVTAAGSPAANDLVVFEVSRAVSDGGDTMAIDARLHGVLLFYTTDAATDA